MKKLFILTSVLALGAISAMAQGVISGANAGSGVNLTLSSPSINGGAAVTAGKPATAAGFGSGAGPGAITVTYYAAANNTALGTLESAGSIVATALNSSSSLAGAQGTINEANITLPNGSAFNGSSAIEVIAYGLTADGLYGGFSTEATGITPATGSQTVPAIFGTGLITSFNLTPLVTSPEPSTIALGGLGAAALLMFRRRK
jgi:hypothetical protein